MLRSLHETFKDDIINGLSVRAWNHILKHMSPDLRRCLDHSLCEDINRMTRGIKTSALDIALCAIVEDGDAT